MTSKNQKTPSNGVPDQVLPKDQRRLTADEAPLDLKKFEARNENRQPPITETDEDDLWSAI